MARKSLEKGQHLFHLSHFWLQTSSSTKTVVVWSVCGGLGVGAALITLFEGRMKNEKSQACVQLSKYM